MTDSRENCPIRHKNGTCSCIGGFCTSVNDNICQGLRNAYDRGKFEAKGKLSHIMLVESDRYIGGTTIGKYVAVFDDRKISEAEVREFIQVWNGEHNPYITVTTREQWRNIFGGSDDEQRK